MMLHIHRVVLSEMMRRTPSIAFASSLWLLQGWGGGGRGGGGGGWGDEENSSTAASGWGKPASNGGWGSARGGSSGGGGGGWGSSKPAPSGGGGGGGWGSASSSSSGGGGGWGGDEGPSKKSWGGGDSGWGGAPTGAARGRGRGGAPARGGRGGGRGGGSFREESNVWGTPANVDAEAWSAAPPSFNPPVRRVDPLTLTAVEVDIDGIKKLVGQRVIITGLSDDTTWHTLKDHVRQVGEVSFCRTLSGGRAIVEFVTPEEAARAISELQGSELEGATLFFREDREDTVLINTRRKIREARDQQLRARKAEEESKRAAKAREEEEGSTPEVTPAAGP